MRTTRDRRGYSLVEMLVVMSALVIVIGLCAGLIQALLKLDRIGRAHLDGAAAADRLAREFRRDVHAARPPGPGQGGAKPADHLELTRLDGRLVDYRTHRGRLVRRERDGDRLVRQEVYRLPPHAPARFEVFDDEGTAFVALVLPRKDRAITPAPEIRIEAEIGRERRLTSAGEDDR